MSEYNEKFNNSYNTRNYIIIKLSLIKKLMKKLISILKKHIKKRHLKSTRKYKNLFIRFLICWWKISSNNKQILETLKLKNILNSILYIYLYKLLYNTNRNILPSIYPSIIISFDNFIICSRRKEWRGWYIPQDLATPSKARRQSFQVSTVQLIVGGNVV